MIILINLWKLHKGLTIMRPYMGGPFVEGGEIRIEWPGGGQISSKTASIDIVDVLSVKLEPQELHRRVFLSASG
jgi:hypothetical protein